MSPLVKPVSMLTRRNLASIDLERDSTQYLSITDAAQTGLDLSGDFLMRVYLKPETSTQTGETRDLITKFGGAGQRSYILTFGNTGGGELLYMYVSDDGSNWDQVYWSVASTFPAGAWHKLEITCDISEALASQHTLTIDDVSEGSATIVSNDGATGIFNSNGPFGIGGLPSSPATRSFDGLIDQVEIYSDLAGTVEVAKWTFSQDLTDDNANGNDLTFNGGTALYSSDKHTETT